MDSPMYAVLIAVLLLVIVVGFDVFREMRREHRRNNFPWSAMSPSSARFTIATTDEIEALKLVATMGKISYVDRERRIIFFDTHLGASENVPSASKV